MIRIFVTFNYTSKLRLTVIINFIYFISRHNRSNSFFLKTILNFFHQLLYIFFSNKDRAEEILAQSLKLICVLCNQVCTCFFLNINMLDKISSVVFFCKFRIFECLFHFFIRCIHFIFTNFLVFFVNSHL